MQSDFSDIDRALTYLCQGLTSAFPQGEVEVLLFRGTAVAPRHTTAATTQLKPVLERYCRDFRGASVVLTPDHVYGLVARMDSHPEFVPGGHKPKHPEDEPRLVILLRRNASEDVLVGTRGRTPRQGPESMVRQ